VNHSDRDHHLQSVDDLWSVKVCPFEACQQVWNRDVNAARFFIIINGRNIGRIFLSLRDHNTRPDCFGPPSEEIMHGPHLPPTTTDEQY